jgi:uracil phosphoribosyltransferase
MKNLTILKNPVIQEIALHLHNIDTNCHDYREYTELLGLYTGIELANLGILPTKKKTITTPLGKLTSTVINGEKIGIVNILRAGTCMALGMGEAFPNATIAFVSAWRKYKGKKIMAESNYSRGIEDLKNKFVIITDPALATGSSLLASISVMKEYIDTSKTVICSLSAAKEGIENIHKEYPEIHIYTAFLEEKMNEKYYIVNGPGDCGDRCFNTK